MRTWEERRARLRAAAHEDASRMPAKVSPPPVAIQRWSGETSTEYLRGGRVS
jgi:hypothetical protein